MMDYKFNVADTTSRVIKWIQNWFETNGTDCNAVIGISGGKDSSVVAALCVAALGKDRVIGVLMPNGIQGDIDDSILLCNHLGIKFIVVDISQSVQNVLAAIKYGTFNNEICSVNLPQSKFCSNFSFDISRQTKVNLPARIRMAALYAVSQSNNGRVANTCNLSEDWVGYSTRYGDSVGDFSPLSQLTSDEVVQIGDYLGLPNSLTHKTPSDGLCGMSDEDNFGFTYAELNRYIRTGKIDNDDIKNKIDTMHQKNLFKLELMPSCQSGLPIVANVE